MACQLGLLFWRYEQLLSTLSPWGLFADYQMNEPLLILDLRSEHVHDKGSQQVCPPIRQWALGSFQSCFLRPSTSWPCHIYRLLPHLTLLLTSKHFTLFKQLVHAKLATIFESFGCYAWWQIISLSQVVLPLRLTGARDIDSLFTCCSYHSQQRRAPSNTQRKCCLQRVSCL